MASKKNDPAMMGGLDPDLIDAAAAAKKVKPPRQPSELDIKKEERLAMKEQRMMERERGMAGDVPVPDTEAVDKSKLLDKISMYRERFPHLKQRSKLGPKSSVEEIQDEMHYIELQLSGAGV